MSRLFCSKRRKPVSLTNLKINAMRELRKKLYYCIGYVVVLGGIAAAGFIFGPAIVAILALIGIALSIASWLFNVRDYRAYVGLNADLKGLALAEKMKILDGEEELWLTYASEEEVQEFRSAASLLPPSSPAYKSLQYLLERAQAHEK